MGILDKLLECNTHMQLYSFWINCVPFLDRNGTQNKRNKKKEDEMPIFIFILMLATTTGWRNPLQQKYMQLQDLTVHQPRFLCPQHPPCDPCWSGALASLVVSLRTIPIQTSLFQLISCDRATLWKCMFENHFFLCNLQMYQ